jgi:hypothetical protein
LPSHKFEIGDTVLLTSVSRNVPGGIYGVTKLLPHNGSEFEYRIKSAHEENERVARESDDQGIGAGAQLLNFLLMRIG